MKLTKSHFIVFTLVIILLAGFSGYYIADKAHSKQLVQNQILDKTSLSKDSVILRQTGVISGVITQRKDNVVTVAVESDNTVYTNTFTLADGFYTYKINPNTKQSSQSADLDTIDLNRHAIINLKSVNGEYQVESIFYTADSSRPAAPVLTK